MAREHWNSNNGPCWFCSPEWIRFCLLTSVKALDCHPYSNLSTHHPQPVLNAESVSAMWGWMFGEQGGGKT